MRLNRSCTVGFIVVALSGSVLADQPGVPNAVAPPSWVESIELDDDFRTFATLQWFVSLSKEVGGVSLVKNVAKVDDAGAERLLAIAETTMAEDAAFQKSAYARACSQPQNLTTAETAGAALNRVNDEIHDYQLQMGRKVAADLEPGLSERLDAVVRSKQGVARVGARADAVKWLAATKKSPAEAVQEICSAVAIAG